MSSRRSFRCAYNAPHDAITELEWERGLEATLRDDERSPVVEWIFMEVQRIASQWEAAQDDEHEGSLLYSQPPNAGRNESETASSPRDGPI